MIKKRKKKTIRESNVPKKVPGSLSPALAILRDNLVEAKATTAYEASFIASILGELIRHGLMNMNSGRVNPPLDTVDTHVGFNKVLQVLTTPNLLRDPNISEKLVNVKIEYVNSSFDNEIGETPDNPRMHVKELTYDAYSVLKDFIERVVLNNYYFLNKYVYEVNPDGIAVITKLEEIVEEEVEAHSELRPNLEDLTDHARRKVEILQTHNKTSGLLVAYDNNWATLAFNHENRIKQNGLFSFFRDVFREDFNSSPFGKDWEDYRRDPLTFSWCIFSANGSNWDDSDARENVNFLTVTLRPLSEIYDEIKENSHNRNKVIAEVHRYNYRRSGGYKKIHPMSNNPHNGLDYPNTPSFLHPKMSYDYESLYGIIPKTRSLESVRAFGDFNVNIDSMSLIGYNGTKKGITTLAIPNSVRELAPYSISNYPDLETLVLPSSVTMVRENAIDIRSCPKLRYIQVSDRMKIMEDNFLNLDPFQTTESNIGEVVDDILIGVFEREGSEITVRPPKGLLYMDARISRHYGYSVENQINPVEYDGSELYTEGLPEDINRINIINTPELSVYKDRITNINIEKLEENGFVVPRGITKLDSIRRIFEERNEKEGRSTHRGLEIPSLTIQHDSYERNIRLTVPVSPDALYMEPVDKPTELGEIQFSWQGGIRRVSLNTQHFRAFNQFGFLREMFLYVNEDFRGNTGWAMQLQQPTRSLIGQRDLHIITNDPISIYNALEYNNKLENVKIYKGTSLNHKEGEVDLDQLKQGNVVILEDLKTLGYRTILKESLSLHEDTYSYVQLLKKLKLLSTIDTKQLNKILDTVEFIEDNSKEYKNIDLDVSYAQIPIILDSDIKVKLVKISHEDSVILVLPNNIQDSYEALVENPEELSRINTELVLYAEILGFDSQDEDLHNIIKKSYLSAGNSLGAFETSIAEPEGTPEEVDEFGGLPDLGDTPDGNIDLGDFEDFSTEELDMNFESIRKFKHKTNSLSKLVSKIKNESSQIILNNLKMVKVHDTLIIEVNNKNIYETLKSTPNLGKTILRQFGEFLKTQENVQLVDSYNNNGKRYFLVAEQAANNYWYTEQDQITDIDDISDFVIPKSDRLIKLNRSNVRLAERKNIPKLYENRIVFIKGGK